MSPVSEIDLYTSLRNKLGDTETRDLIEYVKSSRQITKEDIRGELVVLATKEDLAVLRAATKEDIAKLTASTKEDITKLAASTKEDIAKLAATTREDIAKLATSTKEDFAKLTTSTKEDITELKHLILEQNASLRLEIATVRTEAERGLKDQLKWLIVLLIGFSSLIIAVIKLL